MEKKKQKTKGLGNNSKLLPKPLILLINIKLRLFYEVLIFNLLITEIFKTSELVHHSVRNAS